MNKSNVAKFSHNHSNRCCFFLPLDFHTFFSFFGGNFFVSIFFMYSGHRTTLSNIGNTASLLYQLVNRYDKRNWTKITLSLITATMMMMMMTAMATTIEYYVFRSFVMRCLYNMYMGENEWVCACLCVPSRIKNVNNILCICCAMHSFRTIPLLYR